MYLRDRIRESLHQLNIDLNSPVQTFAAFFLGRMFYQQYILGSRLPDQAIIRMRPFLDESGVLDVLSLESIYDHMSAWMRFGLMIEKMDGMEFIHLMHPCYIANSNVDFDAIKLPNDIDHEKILKLLMLYLRIAEDSRFDPLIPGSKNHDIYTNYRMNFQLLSVDDEKANHTFNSLFYRVLETEKLKESDKIRKLYNLYQKKGLTKQLLLSDFTEKKYDDLSPSHFTYSEAQKERGLSKSEVEFQTLFNHCCMRFRPTDMVQTLFYHTKRDDHPFEITFLLPKLRFLSRGQSRILLVNPSPLFLKQCCDSLDTNPRSELTVAVIDETVCRIYQRQFPKVRFICCQELSALRTRFDIVLVIARDLDYQYYQDGFAHCAQGGHLIYFGPETALSGSKQTLISDLLELHIVPDTFVSVAREATASIGKKKVVLFARKGEINSANDILMLSSFVRNEHFYTDRVPVLIPRTWLTEKLTVKQMLDRYFKYADETKEHYEEPKVYAYSKEISLHYVLLKRSDCVSAKVCYRAVLTDSRNDRRRKRGENLTGFSEKGMRCSSVDQIPDRLERIAFEKMFYENICKDIRQKYLGTSITVKTLWYLCRDHLKNVVIPYRDEEMDDFFCSCSQRIRDLVPSEMTGDEIAVLMEEEYGSDAWKYLEQFHLIFTVCVAYGYLGQIPTGELYEKRLSGGRNRLQEMRDNLSKHFFEPQEEEGILRFLTEPQGRKKTPRCVVDSIFLTGLIRLYTGMPLREVLGLQWLDFYQDPDTGCYSMVISGRVNNDGKRLSFDPMRSQWKFRAAPLHPALTEILLQRRRWLLEQLHFSEDEIAEQPIVLGLEPNRNRRKCAWNHCTIAEGRKITRTILQQAQIPENKIRLLEGDQQFDHDLNAVKRDLFYGNFLHRIIYTCGFTLGQRCYVTGVEPPDTFCAHYVDFGNSLIQYQMIRKLARWSSESVSSDTVLPTWQYQLIQNDGVIQAEGFPNLFGKLEMNVMLDEQDVDMMLNLDIDQCYWIQINRFTMGGSK